MFSLVVTVLQPLALAVLPAASIFVGGIWRPSVLVVNRVRIYLIACMAAGELFWMWAVPGSNLPAFGLRRFLQHRPACYNVGI
jgi:hypothetical protein